MAEGAYPVDLERVARLPDGGAVRLRPIRSDDAKRLQAFHGRLSRDSIVMRFFSPLPVLSDERAAYFATVDYDRRLAIVAVEPAAAIDRPGSHGQADAIDRAGDDELIVGVARYDRAGDDRAEIALIVEDRVQHHGIGSALFWALVDAARKRGIVTLTAEVLAENRRMLRLLRESGLPMRSRRDGTALRVELDLPPSPAGRVPG
jgi:acetyltransferase